MSEDFNEDIPLPNGQLTIQTVAMPKDTNSSGDIFGGWLVSQMDIAGSVTAGQVAKGRVATVAIDSMSFMVPVSVGSIVSCYTSVISVGSSSIQIQIEVWIKRNVNDDELIKVTEGIFVFVAIDENGRTRPVPK